MVGTVGYIPDICDCHRCSDEHMEDNNAIHLKNLLESIFNILPVFIRQWEIQTHWVYTG
jgi:hypothetical protein